MQNIHLFDNGIQVFKNHLTQQQLERYKSKNVHEPEEEKIFLSTIQNLPQRAVFVSVGAAIGYYAILAAKCRPDLSIHCFDPLPRHVTFLKENMAINGLGVAQIQIHQVAISNRSGTVKFLDNSFASSVLNSSPWNRLLNRLRNQLGGRLGNGNSLPCMSVRAITLCDAIGLVNTRFVNFLQMDIQGHERPVLMEFFKSRDRGTIQVQEFLVGTHGGEIHNECRRLFIENKYTILSDAAFCEGQPDGILQCRFKS